MVKLNESPILQNRLACLAKSSHMVLLKNLKKAMVQERGSGLLHQHLPPCPQHVPQTTQNHTAQEIPHLPKVPPVLRKLLPVSPQSTYAPTWQMKRLPGGGTATWKLNLQLRFSARGRRNAFVGKVQRARKSQMFQCVRFV